MLDSLQVADEPSAADLDEALQTYRRLLLVGILIVVFGFAGIIGLSRLGTWLSPPYGVYYLGWSLTEWGLVGMIAALFGYLWLAGRKLGRLLNNQSLRSAPIIGILSAPSVIAEHANAKGLEWSGFFGPLRAARPRTR